MLTITLPDELAGPLAVAAARLGTTAERVAVDAVRRAVGEAEVPGVGGPTLLDFLGAHVGAVAGSAEPLSQDCGRSFADGLTQRAARP